MFNTEKNKWRNLFFKNWIMLKIKTLKLYSPRHKGTLNETLISFKIQVAFKSYRDWSDIRLCFPPDRTWLNVKWLDGRIKVGIEGRGARAQAEVRTLLDFAGHRLTTCNVSLTSLTGHGLKHGSRHGYLIRTWTGQRGPVLYLLVNDRLRGLKAEKWWAIEVEAVFTTTDMNNE